MAAVAYKELERMQEQIKIGEDRAYVSEPGRLASKKIEQGGRKTGERLFVGIAWIIWPVLRLVNAIHQGKPFQPKWAPAPLLRKKERTFPQFGWPRTTDSLCPRCIQEARREVGSGAKDHTYLITENPAEIKA